MIVVTAALLGGCMAAPPERGTLPDVGEVLDPPVACSFLVGPPQGVSVAEVLDDTGAAGVLEAGDVITSLDGAATLNQGDLREALDGESVGDSIHLELLRDGTETTADMVLGPNPDDPERPDPVVLHDPHSLFGRLAVGEPVEGVRQPI